MKKTLLLLCFIVFSAHLFAQWNEQAVGFSTANRGVNQIVITSPTTAWVSGFNPTSTTANVRDFSRTTDGGATWTAGTVSAPSNNNWSCLTAIDENTAWGLFYKNTSTVGGGIYKTTDGGTTWSQQGTGQVFITSSVSFPDVIHFWDANNGVAIGDPVNNEFEIYTTADGGTTWVAVPGANIPDPGSSSEYGLTRSFAARGNTLWFGTISGRIFKTTDMGATWTVLSSGSANAIGSLDFANDNDGWIELDDPSTFAFVALYRTNDGGATWTDITPSGTFFSSYNSVGISYVPNTASTLVTSGLDNASQTFGSAYSLDGGDSWITIDSAVNHFAVKFYNNDTGWSGGVNVDASTGGIYEYAGSFEATGITEAISGYQLKLYPNPSSGLFYISFTAENNLPVDVRIVDAVGKVVFQKTYKNKNELWLRSIDITDFTKGVYFLNVENGGDKIYRKLVVQ
jgi:photosystem II stability/assembly factor-like uncharacterized protein